MGGRGGSARARSADTTPASTAASADESAPAANSLDAEVVSTYRELQRMWENDWVILSELRDRLPGTREQQDAALLRLVDARRIRLIPEENQKILRPRDHAAAIRLAGEDKHLIGIP